MLLTVAGERAYRIVKINDVPYRLVVADDAAEHSQGLSGRTHLPLRGGMLFVYDQPGERCFWMKDMQFAIDIIWADADKRVVHLEQHVQPQTYPRTFCSDAAQYVIEIPAGEAAAHQVQLHATLAF